jgi:hypothetical protein
MIPTAKEFQLIKWKQTYGSDPMYLDELSEYEIAEHMIEFAKLHVEEALKSASENAERKKVYNGHPQRLIVKRVIDKDSILNAYPLTNIK